MSVQSLGTFVRRRRTELGYMTQKDLARVLKSHDDKWLSRIESGTRESIPKAEELIDLAEALQVPPERLLQEAGYLPAPGSGDDDADSLTIYMLIRQIDNVTDLHPDDRDFIRDLISRVVQELERREQP